tara:strand:+ start:3745 stop:4026 length:282 start_codon:yes stop_codon:yes gene_type:complete
MTTAGTPGLKEFDCKNKSHVLWLKKFSESIEAIGRVDHNNQGQVISTGQNMTMVMNNNPMGVVIKPEQFIDVHAGISIKYSGNVLAGEAYIPK